ncbi:MAG: hypothetical protein KDC38_18395, partial [Planctomycetes bacterium]|nr:hypothetical protein [Planctomycetota bacterium]
MRDDEMGSAPPARSRTIARWLLIAWAVLVLATYVFRRSWDVQPVALALAARLADLSIPILATAAFLPIGSRVFRALRGQPDRRTPDGSLDHLVTSSAIGIAAAIGVSIVLAVIGELRATAMVGAAAGASILFPREWRDVGPSLRAVSRSMLRSVKRGPGAIVAVVSTFALVVALTPAVSQDALHYHLEVARRWLDADGFVDVPGIVYSRFPMNVELLFASGLELRGEIAAKAWHWWLGLLAVGAVRLHAGRFVSGPSVLWAPALFISIPSVFRVATWAYVELGLVLYLLLAWDVVVVARRRPEVMRTALLSGLFLGVACGIKYTALPIAAVLALAWPVMMSTRRVATAITCAGSALVTGGFWYARNALELGNPVYPFLYTWFGGAGWDADRAAAFDASLRQWGDTSWSFPF